MSATNPAESAASPQEAKLLESYAKLPNAYDELTSETGQVRPRWQPVLDKFVGLGADGTRAAQDKALRLLEENGVKFAVPGDHDVVRSWRLDLFPMLIDPAEWSVIE